MSNKYSLLNRCYHYIDLHEYKIVENLLVNAKEAHVREIIMLYNSSICNERQNNESQFNSAFDFVQTCLWCDMIEFYKKKIKFYFFYVSCLLKFIWINNISYSYNTSRL